MASTRPGIFIVSAKRTAFGTFGGKLKNHSATQLATIAARAALQSASITPEKVDHIIYGNVIQSSKCAAYLTRHAGLAIGLPTQTPALTVNRLCGSGFQSIIDGALQIIAGDSEVVIAGGAESMSQAPFVVRGTRFGTTFGKTIEVSLLLNQCTPDSVHLNQCAPDSVHLNQCIPDSVHLNQSTPDSVHLNQCILQIPILRF